MFHGIAWCVWLSLCNAQWWTKQQWHQPGLLEMTEASSQQQLIILALITWRQDLIYLIHSHVYDLTMYFTRLEHVCSSETWFASVYLFKSTKPAIEPFRQGGGSIRCTYTSQLIDDLNAIGLQHDQSSCSSCPGSAWMAHTNFLHWTMEVEMIGPNPRSQRLEPSSVQVASTIMYFSLVHPSE